MPSTKSAAKKSAAPKRTAASTKKAAPKRAAPRKSGATDTRAKKVARVSPLRGMPIDAWIESKAKDWRGDVIRRVLSVAQRAAPGATASIKWGQPVFEESGPFLFVRPAKTHVTVGFWRGSEIADPKGLIERGPRMGSWKIASAADLDEKALAGLVRDAVRLNLEKGSPAVRGG